MDVNYSDTILFLSSLTKIWNQYKTCEGLLRMLYTHFEMVANPFDSTLNLVRLSFDYNLSRPAGLSFTVIDQFSNWIRGKQDIHRCYLNKTIKLEAFRVASRQRCKNISKLIIDAYKLKDDTQLLLKPLHDNLRLHMYKEVCEWAILLDLQNEFRIHEFIIPLIFQDRLNVVDEFLKTSPNHHLELVKFLDNIIGERNIPMAINKILVDMNIDNIKHGSLPKLCQQKSLCKLLKRFMAVHSVSRDVTPNLNLRNGISTINFLVRKRYCDETLSREAFREMVAEACGSKQEIMAHVVHRLDEQDDPTEALICARLLSVPPSDMPPRVRELYEKGWKEDSDTSDVADCSSSEQYYPLNLPLSSIIVVDTETAFSSLISFEIVGAAIVGMDLEWKPTMAVGAGDLALIQLATENKVFLIDVLSLSNAQQLWRDFAIAFLNNHDILKLGFAMGADTAMMAQCFPIDFAFKMSGLGYLDLSSLWNKLVKDYNFEFPFEVSDICTSSSLSQLVAITLGKPLNKNEQFSNWEIRPLRITQKIYAALDAFCLIEIYNVIRTLCLERDIPLDDIVQDLMNRTEQGRGKKAKHRGKNRGPEVGGRRLPPIAAKDLRLVCESSLSFLAKLLRRNGIDVAIAESIPDTVMLAESEGRIALSSAWPYKQISEQLPTDKCYLVRRCESLDQYKEVVRHFSVVFEKGDKFRRCQECNGENMMELNKHVVISWINRLPPKEAINSVPAGSSDSEEEYPYYCQDSYGEDEHDFHMGAAIRRSNSRPHIRYDLIPEEVLKKMELFYACQECGHCYWEHEDSP